MKGVSFQSGIEFKITIEGESWAQGDRIAGRCEAISRNPIQPPPPLHVFLVEGNERKVKQKDPSGFQILSHLDSHHSPLDWSFSLSSQARISDNKGSYYLLYGGSEQLEALGQLRLNIIPHLHLRDACDVLASHFRFVLKSTTAGKNGWVDAKFDPPQAKEWTFLEQLRVQFQLKEKSMEAKFQFHRKEVDAMKAGLSTKISQREFERSWDLSRVIHDFNQRLNKEAAIDSIDQVVAEYRQAGWLS